MRVDWLSLGAVQSLLSTDTAIPTKDAILIDVNAAVILFPKHRPILLSPHPH